MIAPTRKRVGAASLVIGAALMSVGIFTPSAQAASVDPTPIEDDNNLKCNEVDSALLEHKINEQPTAKPYTFGDVEIVISNVDVADGKLTFDWSATTVDGDDDGDERDGFFFNAVIVKAGSDANDVGSSGNLYEYDPAVSGDTEMESPKGSISHVSFCYGGGGGTDGDDDGGDDGGDDSADDGGDDSADDGGDDSVDDGSGDVGADDSAQDDGGDDAGLAPTVKDTEVKGEVVLPQQLPRTGDNDQSLFIIGIGFIAIGAIALVAKREAYLRS